MWSKSLPRNIDILEIREASHNRQRPTKGYWTPLLSNFFSIIPPKPCARRSPSLSPFHIIHHNFHAQFVYSPKSCEKIPYIKDPLNNSSPGSSSRNKFPRAKGRKSEAAYTQEGARRPACCIHIYIYLYIYVWTGMLLLLLLAAALGSMMARGARSARWNHDLRPPPLSLLYVYTYIGIYYTREGHQRIFTGDRCSEHSRTHAIRIYVYMYTTTCARFNRDRCSYSAALLLDYRPLFSVSLDLDN